MNFDIDNLKVLANEFPALPSTLGKYIGKHFPLSPLALFNTPAAAHNYFTSVDNTSCSLDSGGQMVLPVESFPVPVQVVVVRAFR